MIFQRVLGNYLILAVNVFVVFGLVLTYTLSVTSGHIKPIWSYISHTGNFPVESCVFSLVFNVCSAVYILIVYLRYTQLSAVLAKQNSAERTIKRMSSWNLTSLLLGILGSFGLSTTGSFQHQIFHVLHLTGVFFCTFFTLLYVILQTYFSFVLESLATSTPIKVLRLLIAILSSCILSSAPIFFIYFLINYYHRFQPIKTSGIVREDSAYKVGVIFEWTLFFLYHAFIYSFYPDFKKIALEKDQIVFLE